MSLVFLTSDEESTTGMTTIGAPPASMRFMTSSEEEQTQPKPKINRTVKKKPSAGEARHNPSVAKKQKTDAKASTDVDVILPVNSGAFAFARWIVQHHLNEDEQAALCADGPLQVGSVCSGMSTECLSCESLKRALPGFSWNMVFVCEIDAKKRKHLQALHPTAKHFSDVCDLQHSLTRDSAGLLCEPPTVDVLFTGISCKSVSGLNSKPESVLGSGPTGTTLKGLRDYLSSMSFESRPALLILENVALLDKKRACENDGKATIIILDMLDTLGYSGDCKSCCSTNYFLPQVRDRVWMLFWKRPSFQLSLSMHEKCAKVMHLAMEAIRRFDTCGRQESLDVILDRLGDKSARSKTSAPPQDIAAKTAEENNKYVDEHGLELSATEKEAFMQVVGPVVPKRAAEACWLKMMHAKKQHGWQWRSDLLVAMVGQSVTWMSIQKDRFPTVTPSSAILVFHRGKAFVASGLLTLAVQGFQESEIDYMNWQD